MGNRVNIHKESKMVDSGLREFGVKVRAFKGNGSRKTTSRESEITVTIQSIIEARELMKVNLRRVRNSKIEELVECMESRFARISLS